MRYIRIWTDEQGESHIEKVEVDFHPVVNYAAGLPAIDVSAEGRALNVHFLRVAADWKGGWHPAPRRQFTVTMSGQAELETSDGARVVAVPGAIVLVEDTTGKGHLSRVVGNEPVVSMVVVLDGAGPSHGSDPGRKRTT